MTKLELANKVIEKALEFDNAVKEAMKVGLHMSIKTVPKDNVFDEDDERVFILQCKIFEPLSSLKE